MSILFLEHKSDKYPPRTYENAQADATIAFAVDFDSPGEILTKKAVRQNKKQYISVDASVLHYDAKTIDKIVYQLNEAKAKTINIAGNSLPTLLKFSHQYSQNVCDTFAHVTLDLIVNHRFLKSKPISIRSGGQSGFDEAGIKAAVKLGIPAICLAPKGWKFLDKDGNTICDEALFKNRFL